MSCDRCGLARVAALGAGLALALAPRLAAAIPVHWISTVDGNWTTVANWDSGFLPRPQDDVIIDAPGSYRVTLNTSVSVKSVVVGGAARTLVLAATASPGMTLTTSLGVQNLGVIELVALGSWTATLRATGGNITNAPGAIITSLNNTVFGENNVLYGSLINQGSIAAPYRIQFRGPVIQNDVGGLFTIGTNDAWVSGTGIGAMQFINDGVIDIPAGGRLRFDNCTVSGGGAISGSGYCDMSVVALNMTNWPTPTTFYLSSITRSEPTLIPAGKQVTLSGGTLNGACDIAGTLNATTLTVNGAVHVLPTGTLRGPSGGGIVARDGLTNEGRISLGASFSPGIMLQVPGGLLENRAPGLVEVLAGGTTGSPAIQGDLRNAGALNFFRSATVTLPAGGHPENSGILSVRGGPVTLQVPAGEYFPNRGTLDLLNTLQVETGDIGNETTGVITGAGSLVPGGAGLVNAGTIRPGNPSGLGRLTFYGSTTCAPTSLIDLEIGGPTASQYDAIGFDQVALDGRLNLALVNGYVPPAGASFPLLDWIGHTGTFAQLTGLDPGNGIHFEPVPGYPAFGPSGVAFLAVAGGASGVANEPPTSDPGGAPRFVGAWPNPARGAFAFGVMVPRAREIDLAVFDVTGRRVRALRQGAAGPGEERVTWDGRDDAGRALAAGVYLVRLSADGVVERRQVTWLP